MSDEQRAVTTAPRTQLVPLSPVSGGLPDWWVRQYGPALYVTSIDATQPAGRQRLLAALNEDSPGKEDFVNQDLDMVDWLIMPAHKETDGGLSGFVRCVVFLADGRRVAFGSQGIVKSIALIERLDRPAPWDPPLRKRLVLRTIGNTRVWPQLVNPPDARTEALTTVKAAKKERYGG